MQKLGWERASRTDKGVHALKNLISVRLMVSDMEKAVNDVNLQLPDDIHVDCRLALSIFPFLLNAAEP